MAFATIALVITCAEVMIFVYHELTPKVFLWSHVSKIILGLVPIAFQISVTQTSWIKQPLDGTYIAVAFSFSAAA
jgi:hypothetical protein